MKINYHHRKFTGVTNSPSGQVSGDTIFHYQQHDNMLTASYSGGSIRQGYLLGLVNEDNSLDFVYHHIDEHQTLKSGHCHSVPEMLPDGRIRLLEKWSWTFPKQGAGNSIVEEIKE
jgi:hypothetical protein